MINYSSLESIQNRKASDETAFFQTIFKDLDLDEELGALPHPVLQNQMSYLSQQNQGNLSRVPSKNELFNMDVDYKEDEEKFSELRKIQTSNFCMPESNTYEKRNRKTIQYKDESDNENPVLSNQNQPCKCSKSNCLKLYCSCFHRNVGCSELCQCVGCHNNSEYSEIRNKALDKIKVKQQRQKYDDDLFDKSTVWGCKCQKSSCKKNYCECYIRGKKCSSLCKCENCQNKKRIQNQQKKKVKIE